MSTFAGVDLCFPPSDPRDHCGICYCEATTSSESAKALYREPEFLGLRREPILLSLTSPLRLGPSPPPRIDYAGDEFKLIESRTKEYADAIHAFVKKRNLTGLKRLAVAFPYGTPPAVRRALPLMLGDDGGTGKSRAGWTFPAVWDSLETPLAASIGLVGLGHAAPPADLLLLNRTCGDRDLADGAPAGAELTAVQLRRDGATLKLGVTGWKEVCVARHDGGARVALEQWMTDPARWGEATLWILHADLEPLGREIADLLRLPNAKVRSAPQETIARGALQHAELRAERRMEGTLYNKVTFERISSRSVGIVGCNREGQLFWRRVLPAGTPLHPRFTAELVIDDLAKPTPYITMFAEASAHHKTPSAWLAQSQWRDFELSLFATEPIGMHRTPEPRKKYRLKVQFVSPAGRLSWTERTIKISLLDFC